MFTKSDNSRVDIVRLNNENKKAFEDIFLSIDYTSKQRKVAFSLTENCKTTKYPKGGRNLV